MPLRDVVAAEIAKVRTLPAAILAVIGTVLVGAAIASALAATATAQDLAAPATATVGRAVPFAQTGIILLGVLIPTHEHTGGQFRTCLVAVPDRSLLVIGKSVAALVTVAVTALLTVGVSLAAAAITQHLSSAGTATSAAERWTLAGAVGYLALIGMLAHTVGLLLRQLVPALVTMLALVLIAGPLLGGVTEHARWLPDRAGSLLYLRGGDTVLTAGTGTLVLLVWIIAIGAAAAAGFIARDA